MFSFIVRENSTFKCFVFKAAKQVLLYSTYKYLLQKPVIILFNFTVIGNKYCENSRSGI